MVCNSCSLDVDRYKRKMTRSGMKTVCRACDNPRVRPSCFNPFGELELDHVRVSTRSSANST